jgi:peroxiredoxin
LKEISLISFGLPLTFTSVSSSNPPLVTFFSIPANFTPTVSTTSTHFTSFLLYCSITAKGMSSPGDDT